MGKFIVFEGLDGAGKSSLIKSLEAMLKGMGQATVYTREPGGTPLAEEIRGLLLRTEQEAPMPLTELLLLASARAQHVESKIRPALHQGSWVLCDRFTASTVAFQHYGRGLERSIIDQINAIATSGLVADQTILLDLNLMEAQRRSGQRGVKDRLEREPQEFHERVRSGYLNEAKSQPLLWQILNAEQPTAALMAEVAHVWQLKGWLK